MKESERIGEMGKVKEREIYIYIERERVGESGREKGTMLSIQINQDHRHLI